MTAILIFSAVIMAVIVWWLMKHTLNTQPWVAQATIEEVHGGFASQPPVRLGLWVFLTVVAMLFMLLIVAYGTRMVYEDWRPMPQLRLLWANTFVLIFSSIALQWATLAVRRGKLDNMRVGLLVGGAFTVVFLLGQILAWQQLARMDYFAMTNPAIAFFYMITGIHGIHLIGGLIAWGRTISRVWGDFDVETVKQSVELCTAYWHFLLLVWFVLFGLLFSGDNLDFLLRVCGLR